MTASESENNMTVSESESDLMQSQGRQHSLLLKVSAVCLLAWTFSSFDQSIFGYAIPGVMQAFEVDLPTVSLVMTLGFVVAAPASLVLGLLADRIGRSRTLTVSLGSSALLVALHAVAPTFEILGLLRILGFALAAGVAPIVTTYAAETAPARYRGVIIGVLQCAFPLGWFLSALATAPLIEAYGWRAPFFTAFMVVPAAMLFLWLLPESPLFRREAGAGSSGFRSNLSALVSGRLRRRTVIMTIIYFLFGASYAGSAFFFPTFLHEVRGYSLSEAASVIGLAYGLGVIGYLASSLVGEFVLTRRHTLIIWTWLGTAAFLGFLWLPDTRLANILWFAGLATFGYGSMPLIQTMKTELFPTRLRATAAAITGGVGLNIGYAGAPVLVATVVEAVGWQAAFSFTVVPALFLCGALAYFLDTVQSGSELG
jgi:MFS family permease